MDKSWMFADRLSKEYDDGVKNFMRFALFHVRDPNHILCLCVRSANLKFQTKKVIKYHLYCNGINPTYINWHWHGEELIREIDEDVDLQNKKFNFDPVISAIDMVQGSYDHRESNPDEFRKLLEDAEKPFYIGCTKFTKLSVLVKMYNLKARYNMSDQCFSEW